MAGYEGSGQGDGVAVQDYEFLGHSDATAKYDSGVGCAGMETPGVGVVGEGRKRRMSYSERNLDQVGDIYPLL